MKEGADMTGAELIKWIQDNHAENMHVMDSDDYCDCYYVSEVNIKDRVHNDNLTKVIFLE